jgi:histidine triad (HIT) family protein
MSTIFTKIINREIPGFFVYEDDVCVVLMDKFPAVSGQVMVVPKEAVAYAFDLSDETYLHICMISKLVAKALDAVFQTQRTCLVIEGFEVPHVHIKLYPMTTSDEPLGAVMPIQTEASDEVLAEQAVRIQMTLEDQTDAGGADAEIEPQ